MHQKQFIKTHNNNTWSVVYIYRFEKILVIIFHAKFLFNVMQLHKYKYLFNIQQLWHPEGDFLEKIRLQTLYCTDSNKLFKLASLQLGVLPRSTSNNHTETDQLEHRRISTSWLGQFTTNRYYMNATLSTLYSSKMQKHLAKMIIHYTKYTLKYPL